MNTYESAKRDRLVSILGMVASVLVMCFLCSSAVDWMFGEDDVQSVVAVSAPVVVTVEPVVAQIEPGQ